MKYLKRYNESILGDKSELIQMINDICLELSDNGFYPIKVEDFYKSGGNGHYKNGTNDKSSLIGVYGILLNERSFITIKKSDKKQKVESFNFSDISDVIYRIKDLIGIDNIYQIYYVESSGENHRCFLIKNNIVYKQIEDESFNTEPLTSFYMTFNFGVKTL